MTRYVFRKCTTAAVKTSASSDPSSALSVAIRSYRVIWMAVRARGVLAVHGKGRSVSSIRSFLRRKDTVSLGDPLRSRSPLPSSCCSLMAGPVGAARAGYRGLVCLPSPPGNAGHRGRAHWVTAAGAHLVYPGGSLTDGDVPMGRARTVLRAYTGGGRVDDCRPTPAAGHVGRASVYFR